MINVARENNSPASRYIDQILSFNKKSFIIQDIENMKDRIVQESGSKYVMYRQLNPDLSKHEIYFAKDIQEHQRIAFTRFRTGSHLLKIETGRWSRVPRENRLCHCDKGEVQDEFHIIESCSLLNETRASFPEIQFKKEGFFNNESKDVAEFLFKALELMI